MNYHENQSCSAPVCSPEELTPDRNRLALFLTGLGGGGAERVLVHIANHSIQNGIPVDLVLNQVRGPYLSDLDTRIQIVDLDAIRIWKVLSRLITYLNIRQPGHLLSTLYRHNFLVLMAQSLVRSDAITVVREANNFSRSSRHRTQSGRLTDKLKVQADQLLLPLLYRRAHQVVAISNGVRRDLIDAAGLPDDLVQTIHNPIDLTMIDDRASEPTDHPWVGDDIPLVVSMGRLVAQKDFPTLIRAFADARQHEPMRLLILGEGNLRPDLEALCETLGVDDDVDLHGFVSNPFAILNDSDLFALTSRWEGFGNVFIEALALGLPVVATDCPSGPAEILEDGRFGTLCEIGDTRAVSSAILQALNDPPDPARQRRRAADFSVDQVVPRYWDALGLKNIDR